MREATKEERAKETAILYTTLADSAMVMLLFIVTFATGSLTMLGEAVRGAFMLSVQFYALSVLFAVHRDRLNRFEYGVAKIEQFVWAIVGLGLLISGLWIADTVVDTLFSPEPPASPFGLAMAAVTNGINTVINSIGWLAIVSTSHEDDSEVFRAQLRARTIMIVSSLFLQVTLTVAALAKDDGIAMILDAVGAIFVVCIMLYSGIGMIAHALPNLLDAPAPADLSALIRATVAGVVPETEIVSIRTRRAGPKTFAEVAIAASAFPSVHALHQSAEAIRQALGHQGADVDVTIAVAPASSSG